MIKDYYMTLGISPETTGEEIKQVYRKLAMQYHPDRNRDDPACEVRLKEINEAYHVLGNEQKRIQYDFLYQQYLRQRLILKDGRPNPLDDLWMLFRSDMKAQTMRGCQRRSFGRKGCSRKGKGQRGKRMVRRW